MVPPAPGLFSTITGWPSLADSSLDIARAITSVALPGVKATMTCTGFSGQFWAWAGSANGSPSASASAAMSRRILSSPYACFLFGSNLPAYAGHIQAAQDAFARRGELLADGGEVASQQLAVALGEAAGDQHVADPCTAALHDDGGDGIVDRPHGERAKRHDGDVGLYAGRKAA